MARQISIAYLGGGSTAWARVLMTDLALEPELTGVVKLYDLNYKSACENAEMGNRVSELPEAVGKWRYEAVHTIEEALGGAEFVVCSILPGTFKEMRSDVHAPEKYGVYQAVGDTVGPGGLIRALRTVPMYAHFACKIKECCPDAWVLNYTNPMSVCTRTLYKVFPGIKAFGCCHEVFDTQEDIAGMLKDFMGIEGAGIHDIKCNILGINHFTWIDRMSYKDMNLMPMYARVVQERGMEGYEREENKHWRNSVFRCTNAVKFDLFSRYGLIAAAGDRHLAEFLPSWYISDPGTVEKWGFALTSVDWRIEDRKEIEQRRADIIAGKQTLELEPTGEEGVRMIKALCGLGDYVTNVNLPNCGQMEGVPEGAVVETNAFFGKDCVQPICAGRLPDDVQALVIRQVYNQEATVEAGLTCDRRLAFNAFVNDPLMAHVSLEDAKTLFDEMIQNTIKYLPGWQDIQ